MPYYPPPPPVAAVQADQETATSTTVYVSPGTQKYNPASCKGWAKVDSVGGTPTASASHNVSSLTDTAAGRFTVNWTTAFSSANYCVVMGQDYNSGTYGMVIAMVDEAIGLTTGGAGIIVRTIGGVNTDANNIHVAAFGDQ